MVTFLTVVLCIVGYIVLAGTTHGYAKHRWPEELVREYQGYGNYANVDKHRFKKFFCTVLWPFYWTFVWPFTKANEVTFDRVEKHAARLIAKNKVRIADLHATREELAKSNAELEEAELELEKETAKL